MTKDLSETSSMDIFVISDWGGNTTSPYTTPEQIATASIMNKVASYPNINPSMIWAMGDNFYDNGVSNISDPRFAETWNNVFDGEYIKSLPFYAIAGNHDYEGNVSAQIEFSNISSTWIYPDLWYSFTWNVSNYSLQLLMIDTVILCDDDIDEIYKSKADDQWDWIEKELKHSQASYIIVGGHYPVWSVGEHGPTKCLVNQLRPLLIKYDVTLLMTGHDHTFEYIEEKDYKNLGYIVTGGTHQCELSDKHKDDIPKDSLKFNDCNNGGFTRIHIDDNGLFAEFYFGNDTNSVHQTKTFHPRKN